MLERYNGPTSRFDCPKCGAKKQFTRYVDNENNYYANNVGRCNREINCGYHLKPFQYFKDNPSLNSFDFSKINQVQKLPIEIDFLPVDIMNESVKHWRSNNFTKYLSTLVGWDVVEKVAVKYNIGCSKHWDGATVFWQVDVLGRPRQAKVMHYNSETGKRTRSHEEALKLDYSNGGYYLDKGGSDKIYYAGKAIINNYDANFKQCFFGEHLLVRNPSDIVGIVESEKTAIIGTLYLPNITWLATGGKHGCKWASEDVCKVLEGRTVCLYPDLGCFDEWSKKMNSIKCLINCNIKISDFLEKNATEDEKEKGYDLADLLLKIDNTTGLAITQYGYPVMWDL
jgi:hypothetical protein